MGAHVVSVNVGTPVQASWAGSLGSTAIKKRSVVGPVAVHTLGVEGDQIADTKHHGGIHQAVYAFAQEDLDIWAERLDQPVPPGMFGENLTTAGLDVNEAVLGSHWRIGTVLLQPVEGRVPCSGFQGRLGRGGYHDAAWGRKVSARGPPRPGLPRP